MLLKSILLVVLLLFVVNPKSRSKSKGKIKKIHPKIDKNGQSVIAMYLHICDDKVGNISWHMNAQRLIQVVIILYINMHGDTYQEICVHIYMRGNHRCRNTKVHIATMRVRWLWYRIYVMCDKDGLLSL